MNRLKIQKDIATFEHLLSESQWSTFQLLFLSPICALFICIPVMFIGGFINLFGLDIFKLIAPFKLSFIITLLLFFYWIIKNFYTIQQDLKTKSYIPITASIHSLVVQTKTNEDGQKKDDYKAQLTLINLIDGQLNSNLEITIYIQEKTYHQLREKECLFMLVGRHSRNYYVTDERFREEGLQLFFPKDLLLRLELARKLSSRKTVTDFGRKKHLFRPATFNFDINSNDYYNKN